MIIDVCSMPLYIIEKNIETIPVASEINWRLAKLTGSHVNINDAYIKIGADLLKNYPQLFPMKQNGETILYPKQISTTSHKSTLGKYLRKRLGIAEGKQITIDNLKRYGQKNIDVSLQGEGIYYFDFSVK